MAAVIHHHLEDLTANQTTSATYVTFATIAKEDLAATNDYLIVARLAQDHNQSNDVGYVRISTADDTSIAAKSEQILEGVSSTLTNRGQLYFFVHSFTTSATPTDVLMQYHSRQAGETTQTDQITFFLLDLTDLGAANYHETVHADDAVEYTTTLADIFTIAGSDLGTDEWACLGYLRTSIGAQSGIYTVQVLAANDTSTSAVRTFHTVEAEDALEEAIVGFALRHKASSGTPNLQIQASEASNGHNHQGAGGYAIALKVSAFADFDHDYQSGATTLDTTERTLATLTSYSPTTTADHLIFGMWNQVLVTATRETEIHVEDDGTEMRVGDEPLDQIMNTSVANRPQSMIFHMDNILSSDTSTYTLQGATTSDTDETVEHRWLMILSLEKGGAGPQTITGSLLARSPTFPTGVVTGSDVTITGLLLARAPTFPTGAVNATNTLDGVLLSRSPTFPTGSVNATNTLDGVLLSRSPTFPTGAANPGNVTLTGVLLARSPTFPTGAVNATNTITGSLLARSPTFPTGVITPGNVTVTGSLLARSPTFPTGSVTLASGPQTITGSLLARSPTFPTGSVNATNTLTGVLLSRSPTFPTGTVNATNTISGDNRRLDLPGTSGHNATTPDHADLNLNDTFFLGVYVALDDWTPAATTAFLSQWTASGNQRAYSLRVSAAGSLQMGASDDGTTNETVTGPNPGYTDGTGHWVGWRNRHVRHGYHG